MLDSITGAEPENEFGINADECDILPLDIMTHFSVCLAQNLLLSLCGEKFTL